MLAITTAAVAKCCNVIQETFIPYEMCVRESITDGKHASLGMHVCKTQYLGKPASL